MGIVVRLKTRCAVGTVGGDNCGDKEVGLDCMHTACMPGTQAVIDFLLRKRELKRHQVVLVVHESCSA